MTETVNKKYLKFVKINNIKFRSFQNIKDNKKRVFRLQWTNLSKKVYRKK